MRQATLVWTLWQRLLRPFASAFTRPGHRRFVEWVTALVLNVEEHTITQSVTAIERLTDWKAMESFAEYGAWKPNSLTRILCQLIEEAPGRVWHGYRISAVDDTKVHRSGEHVWGTCTFHEYTARGCPIRIWHSGGGPVGLPLRAAVEGDQFDERSHMFGLPAGSGLF